MDYCNGLYLSSQEQYLNKLQILQNASARLFLGIPKVQSVSQAIENLHWLMVRKRIKFKALCLVFKALHNMGPFFLKQSFK